MSKVDERYGIFRKQAVEKQNDKLLGDVLVVPPLPYSLVTFAIVLLVSVSIVLLMNGSFARKETVHGFLVPDQGIIRVYASSSGVIRRIFINENESVEEGQSLFMINGDHLLESGEYLETLLLDEYLAQKDNLSKRLSRLPFLFENKKLELNQSILATSKDLAHIEAQIVLLNRKIDITKRTIVNITALRENFLASIDDEDLALVKLLDLQAEKQDLLRNYDSQYDQLRHLELQQKGLSFEYLDQEGQLTSSLSLVIQSIARLQGQRAVIVKANKAGRVSSIQIKEGQEVRTSLPLMTITPEGSELEAELLVPARAIGFVEVGLQVKLRYSAFHFQKFGLYTATITSVSETVLLPSELSGIAISAYEPMYRVKARLMKQNIDAYGKEIPLKEGISLEADIRLAERTLVDWLLEPIISLKGRL